jgi:hypothetical protein
VRSPFRGQEGPYGGPFEGKPLSSEVGFQSLDRVEVGDDRLGGRLAASRASFQGCNRAANSNHGSGKPRLYER